MSIASSASLRVVLYALLLTFFVLSLLGTVGGPDLLGETEPAIWGAILLAWFGAELRQESEKWLRRILWCGVTAAGLLLVGSLGELLFG